MPKPARRALMHQPIKQTVAPPYRQPTNTYQHRVESGAKILLDPAVRAYRALSGEPLITVTETRKFLGIGRTVERKVPLGEFVINRLGDNEGMAAAFLFSLLADPAQAGRNYLDLALYDCPGARIYRRDLEKIARVYRDSQIR